MSGSASQYFADARTLLRDERADWIVGMLIALVGATLSVLVVLKGGYLFFYQNFAPEVIYAACGHGFIHPGRIPAVLEDFVLLKAPTFDCASLGAIAEQNPPGLFARLQLYLSYATLPLWRPPILNSVTLWPLVALLSAAYAGGAYALFRLFFPLPQATIGGLVIAASPIALPLVSMLRDYSKAPFFIWTLVFLILALRTHNMRWTLGWSALAGLVTGIGVGFRNDVVILLLLGVAACLATTSVRTLLRRAPAAAVFLSVAIAAGWPILSLSGYSTAGSLLLQGLSQPYEKFLGLEPAPYSFGVSYSDELALSSVAAAERPRIPDWDANEAPAFYDVSQAMKHSTESVFRWLPLFPADLATQGLKSVAWIVAMPAVIAADREADPGHAVRTGPSHSRALLLAYDLIGHPWLIPLALVGSLVFLWREVVLRPDTALATAVLIGLAAAYTAVQFSTRHVFHLEFIWLLALLSIPTAVSERQKLFRVTRWFPISIVSLVALTAVIYAGLLVYQQHALRQVFAELLALPRTSVITDWEGGAEGSENKGRFVVPVPPEHAQIVNAAPDSMTTEIPVMGLQWDVRAEADRLLLSIEGCPAGSYKASVTYTHREGAWQPFDHDIPVEITDTSGPTRLLVPAFYRPTQNFSTVSFGPLPEGCTLQLERIEGHSVLPPLFTAVFRPGWETERLYRGFGRF